MPQQSLNREAGRILYHDLLSSPIHFPISFMYDGVQHKGLGDAEFMQQSSGNTPSGKRSMMLFALDANTMVTVDASLNDDYGQVEYTVWFENIGSAPSAPLSEIRCLDTEFWGENPLLRGCLGDHESLYASYERDLNRRATYFSSTSGRATHVNFPYFDLVHGNGGTMIALGWAGTWDAHFAKADEDYTAVRCSSCLGFNACLLPGEKIRTALVVMLPYKGRDEQGAANLWREWWRKVNMPRANSRGDEIQPFSTSCFCDDTGLPNSDGSISERSFTWKPTLDKIIAENVKPDFRWFDAGWYFDPMGNTIESAWWGNVGSWELDRVKWPGNSFRESNDACHANGMKVLVWFEPERVTHVDALVERYGYKDEWGIRTGGTVITNNIGDEECRQWTLRRILKMMDENAVDLYREDNNSNPKIAWELLDNASAESTGLARKGIAENMMIQGHYRLWDDIIAYCAEHGKCTYVDSCASGGGRNDIESMRRGVPFLRSDADRTRTGLRLSMTSTFCRWIPFCGASTKETQKELDPFTGKGSDSYVNRASLLPIYNISGIAYTHNPDIDYDLIRRNINEWKSVRHLLMKDMLVLTPWHDRFDLFGWTAFAYHDPDTDESILLAFRQEKCRTESFTARLPFCDENATYTVANDDTGATQTLPGKQLKHEGIVLTLDFPRSSALLRIKRG